MNPTALEIGLIVGLIWLASLTAVVWAHLYESGHFLRKQIARQRTFVEMWEYACEQHPCASYRQSLAEERTRLATLESKLGARS